MKNFYTGDSDRKRNKTAALRSGVLLFLLTALFLTVFTIYGPGVYNDSDQYLKMHIHREPLYPLFLFGLRKLFGEQWLIPMGIVQNILGAFSIWLFAEYLTKRFRLRLWQEGCIALICLMPHVMTMFFSSLHLFMTNSVMSEALCLPLFTIFIMQCCKIIVENRKRDSALALILALLLALTRNQMMLALLMWMVIQAAAMIRFQGSSKSNRKRLVFGLAAVLLLTGLSFGGKDLLVRSYNYAVNGHFIPNTYGPVNTLTNILYAADREDGERIEDPEARAFFYQMYDLTEENMANYRYGGDSLTENAEHLEQWHDTIKYKMIEDVFYQNYDRNVTSDYIVQNLMADETAMKIIRGVLPACFGQWLYDYLLLASYGLVRSVAIVHPAVIPLVISLYFATAVLMILLAIWSKNKYGKISDSFWFMGIALLAILANAFAVSITIMALSRYMIYGFAPFYAALFCMLIELDRLRRIENNQENES